jgi:hypothetical protein
VNGSSSNAGEAKNFHLADQIVVLGRNGNINRASRSWVADTEQ